MFFSYFDLNKSSSLSSPKSDALAILMKQKAPLCNPMAAETSRAFKEVWWIYFRENADFWKTRASFSYLFKSSSILGLLRSYK